MEAGLQRRARIAAARLLLLVAALQIGAGAEGAARAGQHHAAHLVLAVLDRVERLGKPAEHVHGDRVHDLLVIEPQDGDRSVEFERAVLELHRFLFSRAGWSLSVPR